MANCRNCGKPLVLRGGKCIYCGEPIQGQPSGEMPRDMITEKSKATNKDWRKALLGKTWIAIIVTLLLGVLPIIYKAWPGCLVFVIMLGSAISLGILTYYVINLREGDHPGFRGSIKTNLNNTLFILLIWGFIFYIGGLLCLFIEDCKWWVWAIIVYLGAFGGPSIAIMALNPDSFKGKEGK